ncbi:protein CD300H [Equus przewalskii]|uniref:Protein CD300H n=1 Tax=Equus przewalskii TaxID=9798 RepID=A0ABM2EL44_EQUPR
MWLPSALLLLCVPGSVSLSGPSIVTGTVGESLSVQCRYEEEYKTFKKYWCRQPCLPLWHEMVETTVSEVEVRSGRASIVDHTGDLTFTVTLENLTAEDSGKYRCGIATILQEEGLQGFLPDPFFQVQVLVSSASSNKSSTWTPGHSSQHQGFLLLIFLKVPLFLLMLSAVLWVNRPQRAICGETEPA